MTSENTYDAIIVGAGIAGASAAIHFAGAGFRALLLEQRRYPSPKLCGEFLSVEAARYLSEMGALEEILSADRADVKSMLLTAPCCASVARKLPGTGIGVTRDILDEALFLRAQGAGADCISPVHVDSVAGSLESGFLVRSGEQSWTSRVVLGAYGRRAALDKDLGRRACRTDLLAFKWRLSDPKAGDAIEVFGFPGGYIGLCPIGGSKTNACMIARQTALERAGGSANALLDLAGAQNAALARRLAGCEKAGKAIGCSSISFRLKSKFERDVCMIGDAAGMIAPLCGDGMSMAMRSAEIATGCAARFLRSERSASAFRRDYGRRWNEEFFTRISIGRALQAVAFSPWAANAMVKMCAAAPKIADYLVLATRGSAVRA